jgi:hypothetical protein
MKLWEGHLQTNGAKRLIRVDEVAEVRDSPTRLPARFANELYQQGDLGLEYTIFTVVFSDPNTASVCHWDWGGLHPISAWQGSTQRNCSSPP